MHNGRPTASPTPRLFDHLMADRRKVVLATGLVIVMVVMWVRVLTGKKPNAAAAAANPTETIETTTAPTVKLKFVELPVVEGRNDRIGRDFFSADVLSGFRRESTSEGTGTDTEVRTGTNQPTQEVINRVAQKLRVVAVFEGPRAYINDVLVGVGETLSVTDGQATYVFEVVQILDDSVLVRCNDKEVSLKLAP